LSVLGLQVPPCLAELYIYRMNFIYKLHLKKLAFKNELLFLSWSQT
jgi:hypothetical protein